MCRLCDDNDGVLYCSDCGCRICLEPRDLMLTAQAEERDGQVWCVSCAPGSPRPGPVRLWSVRRRGKLERLYVKGDSLEDAARRYCEVTGEDFVEDEDDSFRTTRQAVMIFREVKAVRGEMMLHPCLEEFKS